jgi:hypothetical protein
MQSQFHQPSCALPGHGVFAVAKKQQFPANDATHPLYCADAQNRHMAGRNDKTGVDRGVPGRCEGARQPVISCTQGGPAHTCPQPSPGRREEPAQPSVCTCLPGATTPTSKTCREGPPAPCRMCRQIRPVSGLRTSAQLAPQPPGQDPLRCARPADKPQRQRRPSVAGSRSSRHRGLRTTARRNPERRAGTVIISSA